MEIWESKSPGNLLGTPALLRDCFTFYIIKAVFFFLLALQPPLGVVFYSPLAGFSLLACEVS